jgi:putative endonuclease
MYHVGYMACPEPYVVQGAIYLAPCKVRDKDMYYVYVLKSLVDERLYIGYSANLKSRFRQHQDGGVISTRSRRPLELIFYEGYKSMEDAKRRERYFKTSKGKSSLQLMLQDSLK